MSTQNEDIRPAEEPIEDPGLGDLAEGLEDQGPSVPDWSKFSPAQLAYLGAIARGLQLSDAAREAGVAKATITEGWRRKVPGFREAERALKGGSEVATRALGRAILLREAIPAAQRFADITTGRVTLSAREYDATLRGLRGLLDAAGVTRGPGVGPGQGSAPAEAVTLRVVYEESDVPTEPIPGPSLVNRLPFRRKDPAPVEEKRADHVPSEATSEAGEARRRAPEEHAPAEEGGPIRRVTRLLRGESKAEHEERELREFREWKQAQIHNNPRLWSSWEDDKPEGFI